MISIESKLFVEGLTGRAIIDFLLNATDESYRRWWPGTHLRLHALERHEGHVGDVFYVDEYVGGRRLRMRCVVVEAERGTRVVWRFKALGVLLPARLILETEDRDGGVAIRHEIQAGFDGPARIKDAPLAEFEGVARRFPVFRIVPMERERRPPVRPPAEPGASRTASWRNTAALAIKLVHSLIFLSIAASILQIFYAGVTNRSSRWTRYSLALAVGECLVYAGNRFRCPLTGLTESLGAESGQVTDIFLPRWLADRIPWIFTPPLVAGILGLLWHRRHPPDLDRKARRHAAR